MFAAPVREIARPTFMSAFGPVDADGCVDGVPPHPARSTAITAVTADKRARVASLPGRVDHAMLANVERFAPGRLAGAGGRAPPHHVEPASHRDSAHSVPR